MVIVIRQRATDDELREMLGTLGGYIKVAVDVERRVLAGGGQMHADCEAALLDDGSEQSDVWGADWYPEERAAVCESLINIRPRQGNRSVSITDEELSRHVTSIVLDLLDTP